MTAAIFQKARKNRVIALRTVAARNAATTKPEPTIGTAPRLELVPPSPQPVRFGPTARPHPAPFDPDGRSAA